MMRNQSHHNPYDWAKFIPMRLSYDERKLLTVLENALEVSEYTDNVDIYGGFRQRKAQRMLENIVDMMNITLGLNLASDLDVGENLMKDKRLEDNIPWFADVFEIGRRYKIMNPSKLRGNYGKMMFLLMDTNSDSFNHSYSSIKLDFVKDVLTVYSFLEMKNSLHILDDPLLLEASKSLDNADGSKSDNELQLEKERKSNAMKELLKKYTPSSSSTTGETDSEEIFGPAPPPPLSIEDITRIVNSIDDNNTYLSFNVGPVNRMLKLLTEFFDPNDEDEHFSLALSQRGGKKKQKYGYGNGFSSYLTGYASNYRGSGEKLSHSHQEQYEFVLQSLTLWKEIMSNMPRLWTFADQDMVLEAYHISDTGQGLHRLQSCPRVRKEMNRILSSVQSKFNHWVGLSVVHLGDRDVPNALVFIDKYTQVPNILAPIALCIEQIELLISKDKAFQKYCELEWGSIQSLRLQILADFFKHGFDGSGDDGGSCIDGRLTSAWNWCSKIEKKPFYYVFSFTGFQGFDGEF